MARARRLDEVIAQLPQGSRHAQLQGSWVIEAPVDLGHGHQALAGLVQGCRGLRTIDRPLLDLQQGRHEGHVVGHPVLKLLEHDPLAFIELGRQALFPFQVLQGAAHQLDHRDVHRHHKDKEHQSQGAGRRQAESDRRNEEPPRR